MKKEYMASIFNGKITREFKVMAENFVEAENIILDEVSMYDPDFRECEPEELHIEWMTRKDY